MERPTSLIRPAISPRPPCRWLLRGLPTLWAGLGLVLLLLWVISFSADGNDLAPYRNLAAALGIGWSAGGCWLRSTQPKQRQIGVISLACGNVAALALLFHSPLWLWELNETWPVPPVAAMVRTTTNPGATLTLKGYDERPSLNWYAEQRIERFDGEPGWRCLLYTSDAADE